MNQNLKALTLEDLYTLESMSIRSFNLCRNLNLLTLEAVIQYYDTHQTFKNIPHCGKKSNEELTRICLKYQTILEEMIPISDRVASKKDELLEIIENLSKKQRVIIKEVSKSWTHHFSKRSINALKSNLSNNFSIKNIYQIIFKPKNFQFNDWESVGAKSIIELNSFKSKVREYIETISDDSELQAEYYNAILKRYFKTLDISTFDGFMSDDGSIQVFKLIHKLLENHHLFQEKHLLIFQNNFDYFINFKLYSLVEISTLITITRERIRQIQKKIYKNLPTTFRFLRDFSLDFDDLYDIDVNANIINIKQEIVNNINQSEETNFNKTFIHKVIAIYHYRDYVLIGNEQNLIHHKHKRSAKSWLSTYLVRRELADIFYFEKFVDDVFSRLSQSIKDNYFFNFESYLLRFYKDTYEFDAPYIEEIIEICEKLLFNEFQLVLDLDDNIVFYRNVKKLNYEVIFEILEEAQKPLKLDEIYSLIIQKYPNYKTTSTSIGGAMRKRRMFIFFGRSSTYGLKKWEKEQGLKGGTIRDIVEEFLNQFSTTKHINEITEYVLLYRPNSNINSINSNLKMEEKSRFRFFKNSFIGLKIKDYSKEGRQELTAYGKNKDVTRTWDTSFEMLKQFIEKNNRFPRSNADDLAESRLCNFYHANRSKYKRGLLEPKKVELLKSIGFEFNNSRRSSASWYERYEAYKQFILTHNRLPSSTKDEAPLYKWRRRALKQFEENKLTEDQITLLKEIGLL